ncbi:solute carrier family 49 member 4 homolog [Lineus longissimus]|uniref:solute carrier family 49 member 4 homolog n=1 Tax=Lineus longissimus TaxID=88925 RepID=UPI002B4E2628
MDVDYRECPSSGASSRASSVGRGQHSFEESDRSGETTCPPVQTSGSRTRRCVSAPLTTDFPSEMGESEPLIAKDGMGMSYSTAGSGEVKFAAQSEKYGPRLRTFKRRYYILAVYCWMSFSFGLVWTTWAPIANSAEQALGFTGGDIALLQNSGPIGFLVTFFALSWVVDKKGPRWVMVICSTLLFLGTGLRCFIAFSREAAVILIYVGQFMIGMTICQSQVMAPVISAVWFPAEQRATATALGVLAAPIGMALAGAIEPYIVTEALGANATFGDHNMSLLYEPSLHNSTNSSDLEPANQQQFEEIVTLMIIQTAIVAVGFFCVVFYFPTKPPVPPTMSQSGSIKRTSFKEGTKALFRMPHYWLLCIATSVPCGVGTGWLTLLGVNLKAVNIPQSLIGWIIFVFLLSGVVSGIIIGRIGDYLAGRYKTMTVVLFAVGTLSTLWFTLQIQQILPRYDSTLFISVVICGITLSGSRPMILEMVLELTYPIREGISLSILQLVLNLTMLVFYFIQLIPGVGTMWMNWAFIGVCAIAVPMLIGFKAKYNRLRLDSVISRPNGTEGRDKMNSTSEQ